MDEQRVLYLLRGYIQNRLSNREKIELSEIMKYDGDNPLLGELMEEVFAEHRHTIKDSSTPSSQMWQAILNDARFFANEERTINRKSFLSTWYYLAGAAACILVGYTIYFFQQGIEMPNRGDEILITTTEKAITPGREQATLTLPGGKVVALDSLKEGTSLQGEGFTLRFEDGQIKTDGANDQLLSATTTLRTPHGGEYQTRLSDGTSVWLNAGSSITYPLVFHTDKREVTITGEVFFDVEKDRNKPFVVHAEETSITVLGTSFNVSAYPEDMAIRTTLIEGSVRMQKGQKVKNLLPGQQALVQKGESNDITVQTVDIEEAIAWKNGYFYFHKEDIQSAMKKIGRWYNVEVKYEGELPDRGLDGTISRMEDLRQLLDALELTGAAQFSLEERRIIVRK